MNKLQEITIVLCLIFAWTAEAVGHAPPYITDADLAAHGVVVIAQWEKAPFTRHFKENEATIDTREVYTRLRILEVIKGDKLLGDFKSGEVELMTKWGIAWDEDGKSLRSGTSSYMHGEVEDVTQPAIWFLRRQRSWDAARETEYLMVNHYRQVQPIELKAFFVAMTGENANHIVAEMLSMEHTLVSQRVVKHLCGGIWPWPFDPGRHANPYTRLRDRDQVFSASAQKVWKFVQANPGRSRPISVAAYAQLKGKDCVSRMRELLDDGDAGVRLVAIGVLAKHRDRESIGRFARAASGFTHSMAACNVLEELGAWMSRASCRHFSGFWRMMSGRIKAMADIRT